MSKCSACGGKGKYVGLTTLEDPCKKCLGMGRQTPLLNLFVEVVEYAATFNDTGAQTVLSADNVSEARIGFTVFNSDNTSDPENDTRHFSCHLTHIREVIKAGKLSKSFKEKLKVTEGRAQIAVALGSISRNGATPKDRYEALYRSLTQT